MLDNNELCWALTTRHGWCLLLTRADPIHQAVRKPPDAGPVTPFRPGNPPKKGGPGTVTRNFGARAKGAVGEFEWRPRPDAVDQSSSSDAGAADAAAAAEPGPGVAFKPAAFPHKGPLATFNRFPGGPPRCQLSSSMKQSRTEVVLECAMLASRW